MQVSYHFALTKFKNYKTKIKKNIFVMANTNRYCLKLAGMTSI